MNDKITELCCNHKPMLYDGCLAFVCDHGRDVLKDRNGYYILEHGVKVFLQDLTIISRKYTDRFGMISEYSKSQPTSKQPLTPPDAIIK
jgi:hypothetical protein